MVNRGVDWAGLAGDRSGQLEEVTVCLCGAD